MAGGPVVEPGRGCGEGLEGRPVFFGGVPGEHGGVEPVPPAVLAAQHPGHVGHPEPVFHILVDRLRGGTPGVGVEVGQCQAGQTQRLDGVRLDAGLDGGATGLVAPFWWAIL